MWDLIVADFTQWREWWLCGVIGLLLGSLRGGWPTRLLAPVLEIDRDGTVTGLSLGRLSMCAWLWVNVWCFARHPNEYLHLNVSAAALIAFVFIVLAAYCYGNKPHMRGYLDKAFARLPDFELLGTGHGVELPGAPRAAEAPPGMASGETDETPLP